MRLLTDFALGVQMPQGMGDTTPPPPPDPLELADVQGGNLVDLGDGTGATITLASIPTGATIIKWTSDQGQSDQFAAQAGVPIVLPLTPLDVVHSVSFLTARGSTDTLGPALVLPITPTGNTAPIATDVTVILRIRSYEPSGGMVI